MFLEQQNSLIFKLGHDVKILLKTSLIFKRKLLQYFFTSLVRYHLYQICCHLRTVSSNILEI